MANRRRCAREPIAARQCQREMQIEVVLQIATDARTIDERIDPELLQIVGRTDAGAQQHRGGMNRARAHDHLARVDVLDLAGALDRHAVDPAAADPQRGDAGPRHDREVAAPARRAGQIASCARGTLRVLAERHREEAVGLALIDVGDRGQTARGGGALHGGYEGGPFVGRYAPDRI